MNDTCQIVKVEEMVQCGRCFKMMAKDDAEICWYCINWLCYDCWDNYGHCGHIEADRINQEARSVKQPSGN